MVYVCTVIKYVASVHIIYISTPFVYICTPFVYICIHLYTNTPSSTRTPNGSPYSQPSQSLDSGVFAPQKFDITPGAHQARLSDPIYAIYIHIPKWLLHLLSVLSLLSSGGICLLNCFLAFALCIYEHPTHQNKPWNIDSTPWQEFILSREMWPADHTLINISFINSDISRLLDKNKLYASLHRSPRKTLSDPHLNKHKRKAAVLEIALSLV